MNVIKTELIFPKIEGFIATFSHNEPLSDTLETAALLIAEQKSEIVLSQRVYTLSKGDAVLALPYSYLRQKTDSRFFGYQIHFFPDTLRAFTPNLFLKSADGGLAFSFSMSSALRLLSVCESISAMPPLFTIPMLFSILETDALPQEEVSLSLPLPKLLRRALAFIEEETPRKISAEEVALRYDVGESTILRLFRTHLGTTPNAYSKAQAHLYEARNKKKNDA